MYSYKCVIDVIAIPWLIKPSTLMFSLYSIGNILLIALFMLFDRIFIYAYKWIFLCENAKKNFSIERLSCFEIWIRKYHIWIGKMERGLLVIFSSPTFFFFLFLWKCRFWRASILSLHCARLQIRSYLVERCKIQSIT